MACELPAKHDRPLGRFSRQDLRPLPAWTNTRNWTAALLAFKIHFGDRLPD